MRLTSLSNDPEAVMFTILPQGVDLVEYAPIGRVRREECGGHHGSALSLCYAFYIF